MSEFAVNYRSSVLSILKSHTDCEEDNKEVRVEDWRKIISNSAIKCSDFVNADKTTVTKATMNVEELWRATLFPFGERESWSSFITCNQQSSNQSPVLKSNIPGTNAYN